MLCFMIACFFLSLKVESRIMMTFEQFLSLITQLSSCQELEYHLTNDTDQLSLISECYPTLEGHVLQMGLNFKIDFVSSSQAIYQILCTFKAISNERQQ